MDLIKERKGIEKKFYDLCNTVVSEQGLELYGLDYISSQSLLRLFIQDPTSKTAGLEECSKVDRAMTPFVESETWMPEELTLEVSSPGVYRDVKEGKWFHALKGERVSFQFFNKISESNFLSKDNIDTKLMKDKKVILYLVDFDEESVFLSSKKDGESEIIVSLEDIKKANVEPLWDEIKE